MDTKSSVNFSAVPAGVAYKDALSSSTDHIRDSRKVVIHPSSGSGSFGPGSQTECTFFVDDGANGSFLHPDSCYITCDIQTVTAVGGQTGVASANFNSSANDILDRVTVRGKRSRVQLADCRSYGLWSALQDKLYYPKSYEGHAPWSRGFVDQVKDDGHPDANAVTLFSNNYGLVSRGASNVVELGAGTRRYKLELKYCPFFASNLLIPLSSTGGIAVDLSFARVNDAFVGFQAANSTAATTALDYRVTNVRFHCLISYMEERFMQAYNSQILKGGISIPYDSYVSLQHVPQSTNENLVLSRGLEFCKSVFVCHRFTSDLNAIAKPSLAHLANPLLEEIQLVAGGLVQPTTPLITATSSGTNVTGQMVEELVQAQKTIDSSFHSKDFQLQKQSMEITLATAAKGTAIGSNTGPKFTEVAGWNGCHIVGLSLDSGSPFSSIYNRSNSSMQDPQRKSDLMATMKYTSDPSAYTTNVFMYHSNILKIGPNGSMIPYQLSM